MRRGDDLAVDLDQLHDVVSKRPAARSISASPCARLPKRKFSPTETRVAPSRSTSSWSMNSCAVARRTRCRTGSRRAPRRRAPRSGRPCARACQQLRRGVGATTARGCGSNVSTVSEPRITSRWPRCTPSNSPTATRRGAVLRVGEPGDLHQPRKPTTGLSVPPPARLGDGDQARVVAQAARALGARRRRRRRAPARRASLAVELDRRQEARAHRRAPISRSASASATSNAPIARAPQLDAVGVAELGDQRAHVRAATSTRSRSPARSPSRQSCSNRWTSTSRSGISTASPRARSAYARSPPIFTAE